MGKLMQKTQKYIILMMCQKLRSEIVFLLHVLLVFKIKSIFGKKISTQKCAERGSFLYI